MNFAQIPSPPFDDELEYRFVTSPPPLHISRPPQHHQRAGNVIANTIVDAGTDANPAGGIERDQSTRRRLHVHATNQRPIAGADRGGEAEAGDVGEPE